MPELRAYLEQLHGTHKHLYEPLGSLMESCVCGSVRLRMAPNKCDSCPRMDCAGQGDCPEPEE